MSNTCCHLSGTSDQYHQSFSFLFIPINFGSSPILEASGLGSTPNRIHAISRVLILKPLCLKQFSPKYSSSTLTVSGYSLTMWPISLPSNEKLCRELEPYRYNFPLTISLPSFHRIWGISYSNREFQSHEVGSCRISDRCILPLALRQTSSRPFFLSWFLPFLHLSLFQSRSPWVDLFRHLLAYLTSCLNQHERSRKLQFAIENR